MAHRPRNSIAECFTSARLGELRLRQPGTAQREASLQDLDVFELQASVLIRTEESDYPQAQLRPLVIAIHEVPVRSGHTGHSPLAEHNPRGAVPRCAAVGGGDGPTMPSSVKVGITRSASEKPPENGAACPSGTWVNSPTAPVDGEFGSLATDVVRQCGKLTSIFKFR